MVPTLQLPRYGRVYLWAVIAMGLAVISDALIELTRRPIGYEWFIIAGLTLISGCATVRLPSSYASISISETFVFTAVLLYGPAAGTLIVALDGLVISFWLAKRHREPHRALFNMSAPALSVWCSSHVFFLLARVSPLVEQPASINRILPALILFAITYFGLNSWLITFIIALERRLSPFRVWKQSFLWWSMNYFCGASVAILFVGFNRTIDLGYIGVILPLLLVLYATFKTSIGRVEDAERHVQQINRLYLSTIETLAMAIDAKDQVTHGHIRRVQTYATSLAREIGVRDEQLLKAIEAAALLHDMGKLAVPEHILNKPGKLTAAEFDRMKMHADVGADILSAIDFPYPVVPIVRHHHENWDGSGYPAGLRGTDIPIGARILSVVDCFDALTSDRPYRPKLPDDEAIQILRERSGFMYDPLIVDTFIRVRKRIATEQTVPAFSSGSLRRLGDAGTTSTPQSSHPALDEIAASAEQMLTLYELARALAGHVALADAGDVIAKHLRRLIPFTLSVFYQYDAAADDLEAKHAMGDGAAIVRGIRIPIGERLSGWVAANRQTICNSDPILDFGDVARSHPLALKSCLSTVLAEGDRLVGVLALYMREAHGFTDDHRRIIEVVARQISHTLDRAKDFETNILRRDHVTGLPNVAQLEQLVGNQRDQTQPVVTFSLVFVNVTNLADVRGLYGDNAHDEALRHVVRQTRKALRVADILFRLHGDKLAVLLSDTDETACMQVASRVLAAINEEPLDLSGVEIHISAHVTSVSGAGTGQSLNDLLASAQSFERHTRTRDASVH